MKKPNKVESFTELIKHLYVYIVLIITMVIGIFGGINLFNAVADYVIPESYGDRSYSDYVMYGKGKEGLDIGFTEAKVREMYDESKVESKEREKNQAIKSIIKCLGSLIIALPIFFIFQRKVNFRRKEVVIEEDDEDNENIT